MAFATKPVNQWSVSDVADYLDQLELSHLKPSTQLSIFFLGLCCPPSHLPPSTAFKENAVSGSDLQALTEEDFVNELKVSKLQYRKIKTGLASLEG